MTCPFGSYWIVASLRSLRRRGRVCTEVESRVERAEKRAEESKREQGSTRRHSGSNSPVFRRKKKIRQGGVTAPDLLQYRQWSLGVWAPRAAMAYGTVPEVAWKELWRRDPSGRVWPGLGGCVVFTWIEWALVEDEGEWITGRHPRSLVSMVGCLCR